jgi:peptide/nickel transport system permease protein
VTPATPGLEAGAAAPGPRSDAPTWQVILAAAIPGFVPLLRGQVRLGLLLLGYVAAMVAVVAHEPAAFAAALRDVRPGHLDRPLAALSVVAVVIIAGVVSVASTRRRATRREGVSEWALAARQFRKNGLAVVGLNLVLALYVVALLAPLLAPHDPDWQADIFRGRFLPPSPDHWLGTDYYSRDILSRVIYGSRISLSIGFVAVAISITIGTAVGAFSGYVGGKTDAFVMRCVDMLLAFPRLVLLLAIVNFWSPSIFLIVAILGLTGWMGTTRLVRGQVLSLREQEFMAACRALGASPARAIFRHLVPNAMAPVIVSATLGIGATILVEASLSYLGLGVPPPTATWGAMVSEGRDALTNAWWVATFPGLAVVVAVCAFNLIGDGLRDALDPRMRTA